MEFKKRSGCECPDLEERKEYLIMGHEEGSFFVFDEKSFVIPWVKKRKSYNLNDLRARVGIDPRCTIQIPQSEKDLRIFELALATGETLGVNTQFQAAKQCSYIPFNKS